MHREGLKVELPLLKLNEYYFCKDTGELWVGDGYKNVLINSPITMQMQRALWGAQDLQVWRKDLVSNGAFASSSYWTLTGNVAIGAGVMSSASGGTGTGTQIVPIIPNTYYWLVYTATASTGKTIQPSIGGTVGTERNVNGTYVERILSGSVNSNLIFTISGNPTGTASVDNVFLYADNIVYHSAAFTSTPCLNGLLRLFTISMPTSGNIKTNTGSTRAVSIKADTTVLGIPLYDNEIVFVKYSGTQTSNINDYYIVNPSYSYSIDLSWIMLYQLRDDGVLLVGNGTEIPDQANREWLINASGAASVKGTVVSAFTVDRSFANSAANAYSIGGVVLKDGIANGASCWIVNRGIAEGLLQDGTAAAPGNWAAISQTVAGRMDCSATAPAGGTVAALERHFKEMGHNLLTVATGTFKMTLFDEHFN